MRTLDSTIAYPFFMAFFDYATKVGLAETEIYQVLDVIEAYWARRIICNLPSNALNKVFATLHRDVLNHVNRSSDETSPSYIDVLKYVNCLHRILRKSEARMSMYRSVGLMR